MGKMDSAFNSCVEELHTSGELKSILSKRPVGPTHTSVPYALALHTFVCAKNVEGCPDTPYPCVLHHANDMFRRAVQRVVDRMN